MNRIAFIFPGQGAQYVGMGKEFYDACKESRNVFELAGEVTGLDMKALCFEENDQIHQTEYTQAAMVTAELAMLKAVKKAGITAEVYAGLSLGEYAALAASGTLKEADALRLVRKRGILMQNAVPEGGAMSAVLGLEPEKIEEICEKTEGIVSVANYNCPGQTVITGEQTAVEQAAEQLKEAGAKRVVPLNVSGPFHSAMLKEAGKELGEVLRDVQIHDIAIPYVSNVTAAYVTDKEEVKPLLEQQVWSSVRWQQSVETMIEKGIDTFIEIGPGRTLTGFMKKINRDVTACHIEKPEDLEKVLGQLKGE